MDHTKAYPMPANPEGETLRQKLEAGLGYPVTGVFDPSPVRVIAEDGELVVHLEAPKKPAAAIWAKVDAIFAAHVKNPNKPVTSATPHDHP